MRSLEIQDFIVQSGNGVILDVRSPKEFAHGHIPGAFSFPLFTDQERHLVGTAYKKEGREKAIVLGLEIVGPKLAEFVKSASQYSGKTIYMHCWRGGMRSNSMAILLETVGHKVVLLKKGYKAYRNFVLAQFTSAYKLASIAGYTGAAKTEILHVLKSMGQQIVDIEDLAKHKGSVFGNLDRETQPGSEQFENDLAHELLKLDPKKIIFFEDEGSILGHVKLPDEFFNAMQRAPMLFVERPKELRLKHLMNVYGKNQNPESLKDAFLLIAKRLGGQNVKDAFEAIEKNDAEKAINIALGYYDKYYYRKLNSRSFSRFIKVDGNASNREVAAQIIEKSHRIYG